MEGGVPEDKCALVAELVQVLEMARQLETHMAAVQQQQGGGGAGGGADQRCRALVSTMRASISRAVHMAVSCCGAEGQRPAGAGAGQPESPPSGGDGGSPRSGGSDQAGEFRGRGNAAGQCKKRKTLPKWSSQVRVSAVQDVSPLDDGLSWRKYGQKDILGAKYPRSYFRCTHRHTQSCQASKQVQRTDGDPLLFDVVYHGAHTCAQGAAAHPSNQPAVQEQTTSPGLEAAGPAVLPFSLLPASPNKPTTGANAGAGSATSSRFATGCVSVVTAPPFVSPATPESQLVSSSSGSGYAVGGGVGVTTMAGVRNVPDVELASATNSPAMAMGEMDFVFPLDAADFLELGNPAHLFLNDTQTCLPPY